MAGLWEDVMTLGIRSVPRQSSEHFEASAASRWALETAQCNGDRYCMLPDQLIRASACLRASSSMTPATA